MHITGTPLWTQKKAGGESKKRYQRKQQTNVPKSESKRTNVQARDPRRSVSSESTEKATEQRVCAQKLYSE